MSKFEVLNQRFRFSLKEEVIKMVANNAFIIKEMEDNAAKRKAIEIAKNLIK